MMMPRVSGVPSYHLSLLSTAICGAIIYLRRQWYLHTIYLPSLQRFLPRQHTEDICATCRQQLDFRHIFSNQDEIDLDRTAADIGLLDDIHRRSSKCAFCRCISHLSQQWWLKSSTNGGADPPPSTRCYVYRQRSGVFHNASYTVRRNCYHMIISTRDPYLPAAAAAGAEEPVFRAELQLLSQDAKLAGTSPLFQGRLVKKTEMDLALVRRWLRICEVSHHDSCEIQPWRTLIQPPRNLRMIDVHKMCVCDPPTEGRGCRYITLSYRWSKTEMLVLNRENRERLYRPSGLKDVMVPKTIKNAITLVGKLGERYLWVDSLCILQDSEGNPEKLEQMNQMDRVYGSAVLTIIAAVGNDAEAGLPGVDNESREVDQGLIVLDGMRVVRVLPTLEDQFTGSTWNTRGWTYQEQLLSARKLVFTHDQIYFQCSKDVWCEDIFGEDYIEGASAVRAQGSRNLFGGGLSINPRSPKIPEFRNIVAEYTTRDLTMPSDALNALAGTASIFRTLTGQKLVFGVPEADFEDALLWQPRRRLTRRGEGFPSWAWCGWVGPVKWRRETNFSIVSEWGLRDKDGSVGRLNVCRDGTIGEWTDENYSIGHFPPRQLPRYQELCAKRQSYWRSLEVSVCEITRASRPGNLIFWTTTAYFTITDEENTKKFWYFAGERHPELGRYCIFDREDRKVGTMLLARDLNKKWCGKPLEFIALSAGVERGDMLLYSTLESVLYYNVMLVHREDDVAYRVGVGKVQVDAWNGAAPEMRLVELG